MVLVKHGPCSQGDLYKHAPWGKETTHEAIGAWVESAIDRGLITPQRQPGGTTGYAVTDAGEAALYG
jgi:hypothetical protein